MLYSIIYTIVIINNFLNSLLFLHLFPYYICFLIFQSTNKNRENSQKTKKLF